MTTATLKALERIKGRNTLYELVCSDSSTIGKGVDQITYLLRYASRSKSSLAKQIRHHGVALVKLTGATEATWNGQAAVMGQWLVYWTGRTERDAIIGGEHPYITNIN